MKYYFAWVDEDRAFFAQTYCREDLKIVSFELSQQEGEAAILSLKVARIGSNLGTNCLFSYSDQGKVKPLFAGKLMTLPMQNAEGLWLLEFKSHVDLEGLKKLCASMDSSPYTCKDLYSNDENELPRYVLEGKNGFFHFDRVSGKVSFSDFISGKKAVLSKNVFQGSIQARLQQLPLSAVDVQIEAKWLQKDQGEVDISHTLRKAFPSDFISTFTGEHFERSFPWVGDKLGLRRGKSGCRVVEAEIVEVDPPDTGVLDAYPTTSHFFWEYDQEGQPQKNILKRRWYSAKLVVDWQYKQRREEVCHFTVKHKTNFPLLRPAKKLKLNVQNLGEIPLSSYFKTDRGKAALEHAICVASAHLRASWRMGELSFSMPIDEAIPITLNHAIDISQLLGLKKKFYGKVMAYKLINHEGVASAVIRVAISLENVFDNEEQTQYAQNYVVEDYTSQITRFYDALNNYQPKGIKDTSFLHTSALVRQVRVINGPQEQENLLQQPEDGIAVQTKEVLGKNPTKFEITLQDLRTESNHQAHIYLGDVLVESKSTFKIKEVLHAH